ncbi:MAG TPA: DUF4142 domain-containing protein [Cytophagaceae bacterium]
MRKNTSLRGEHVQYGTLGNYVKKSAFFLLALLIVGFTGCDNDDDNVTTPQGNVIDGNDVEFAERAGQWNRAQIEFGKLALEKSGNDEVKAYAQQMIDTYTAAQQDLANTLSTKGINFVDSMSGDDQERYDHISKQISKFDEKYMDDQEKRLKKMEDKYDDYEDKGDDADLRAYAGKYLPTIRDHRKQADTLEDKVD